MKHQILPLAITISMAININAQTACTYVQGFYGSPSPMGCYDNSTIISSKQFMLNAFGSNLSQVFGNVANKRFFTLFKTDITNNNIFSMLPGAQPGQRIAVDNVLPYDGAYYGDASTWSLVPIQPTGTFTGRINNLLLAQTITLWFNLHTSSTLGSISLAQDTLVTSAQTSCGSGVPTGSPSNFGLPHNIILYLNAGNGYSNDVNGLFQLANDVLGAVNTTVYIPYVVQAVTIINQAFEGCRILVGTIPAAVMVRSSEIRTNEQGTEGLITIKPNPNPSASMFSLNVSNNDHNSQIKMQVVDIWGRLLEKRVIVGNTTITIGANYPPGVYIAKFAQDKNQKQIKLVKLQD